MQAQIVYLSKPQQIEIKKEELTPKKNQNILCHTIYTGISTGTEISAYLGENSLRHNVTYPRLMGYLNISRVIQVYNKKHRIEIEENDLVITNQSHRSQFWIEENEILAKLEGSNVKPQLTMAYLYFLAAESINMCDRKTQIINIYGSGLISSIASEIIHHMNISSLTISNFHNNKSKSKNGFGEIITRDEFDKKPSHADNSIIFSSNWSDIKRALKTTNTNGNIIIIGFPGRDQTLPNFNVFDSREFYSKNLNYRSPSIEYQLLKRQKHMVQNFANQINLGFYGKQFEYYPIVESSEISEAYKNLVNTREYDTFFVDWRKF